jgi:hypothetical protein
VLLGVIVPLPSWPLPFAPQHFTPPDASSAQLRKPPAAMPLTPDDSPLTATGDVLSSVVPSPSSPLVLSLRWWSSR